MKFTHFMLYAALGLTASANAVAGAVVASVRLEVDANNESDARSISRCLVDEVKSMGDVAIQKGETEFVISISVIRGTVKDKWADNAAVFTVYRHTIDPYSLLQLSNPDRAGELELMLNKKQRLTDQFEQTSAQVIGNDFSTVCQEIVHQFSGKLTTRRKAVINAIENRKRN